MRTPIAPAATAAAQAPKTCGNDTLTGPCALHDSHHGACEAEGDRALLLAAAAAFGEHRADAFDARRALDALVRAATALDTFAALVHAPGGYRPTLRAVGPGG